VEPNLDLQAILGPAQVAAQVDHLPAVAYAKEKIEEQQEVVKLFLASAADAIQYLETERPDWNNNPWIVVTDVNRQEITANLVLLAMLNWWDKVPTITRDRISEMTISEQTTADEVWSHLGQTDQTNVAQALRTSCSEMAFHYRAEFVQTIA